MKRGLFVLLLTVASIVWSPQVTVAQGGEILGACVGLDVLVRDEVATRLGLEGGEPPTEPMFDICVDGVTEQFCLNFCGDNDGESPEPGGPTPICFWDEGGLCTDQQIPWDGACEAKGLCILLFSETPGASAQLCGDLPWFPGATECGAPVPVVPKVAYGALALVLLAGSLGLLMAFNRS